MATFKSKEELLKAIEVGFEAINQGTINLEQMDELVNSARDLYERTVIIRHKSLELLVANQSVSFEKDVHKTVAPVIEHATPAFATEELIIEEPLTPSEDETPILVANDVVEDKSEFTSSFSVQDKEDGFAFDLFEQPIEDEPQNLFAGEVVEETFVQEEPLAEIHAEEPEVEMPKAIHEIMQENIGEFSVEAILEEEQRTEKEYVEDTFSEPTFENPVAETPASNCVDCAVSLFTSLESSKRSLVRVFVSVSWLVSCSEKESSSCVFLLRCVFSFFSPAKTFSICAISSAS